MNRLFPILGVAWFLSLAAAFMIGQGAGSRQSGEAAGERNLARAESRAAAGKSARSSERGGRDPSARGAARGGPTALTGLPPRQAVVELARLNDPVERTKGFLALIDTLGADDFRDVVADFRALGMTDQRRSEYGMLLHAWGKADPQGALAYALKETGTPFARQTILASWAADDPSAAVAFARENHKGEGANPLLVGVIRGIAPHDLNRATDLLQDLPYSRERGDALQSMLPFVMQDGVDLALNWTQGIADERLKSGALTYIITDLSASQPEQAAEVLVGLEDNAAAVRVADDVGGSLARLSIDRAVTWLDSLPENLRSEAAEGIVGPYASKDPRAAAQWLETISPNTNLDAAIRSFAWTAQRQEPQLAAEWIGRITNEGRRNEMYRGVLSRWLGSDAAAATSWIQAQPDLPEPIRQLPERVQERREGESRRTR